jgi:hypothetical protein
MAPIILFILSCLLVDLFRYKKLMHCKMPKTVREQTNGCQIGECDMPGLAGQSSPGPSIAMSCIRRRPRMPGLQRCCPDPSWSGGSRWLAATQVKAGNCPGKITKC